jgi:hypothetical protein
MSQKFSGPGPVSTGNLLVLNIGMEEIKFVEHKINLHTLTPVVVTE